MPQVRSTSLEMIDGWSMTVVYQVDVGARRNMISVSFRTSRRLMVGLLLWYGVSSWWKIHPLVGGASESYALQNLWISSFVVMGHSSAFYERVLDVLLAEGYLRRPSLEACLELFPRERKCCTWCRPKLYCFIVGCFFILHPKYVQQCAINPLNLTQWASVAALIVLELL